MTATNSGAYRGSGVAELVIGVLMMLAGVGLFVYAFQSVVCDLPYTASAWLLGLALGAVGIFVWSSGVRKQRIACDLEQQKMAEQKAQAVATEAIARAREQ